MRASGIVQTMPVARWLVLAAIVAGCGGQTTTATTHGPTNAALSACIPVVPLRLLVLEHGSEWEPIADLQPDGTVYYGKKSAVARIANDQVSDIRGQPIFQCVNGELLVPGQHPRARFEPNGDLVDAMMRIHVEPNGMVFMVTGGNAPKPMGRVEGPQQSPRTAAILVLIALANGNWSFH
jgi:hypothetical protein